MGWIDLIVVLMTLALGIWIGWVMNEETRGGGK